MINNKRKIKIYNKNKLFKVNKVNKVNKLKVLGNYKNKKV